MLWFQKLLPLELELLTIITIVTIVIIIIITTRWQQWRLSWNLKRKIHAARLKLTTSRLIYTMETHLSALNKRIVFLAARNILWSKMPFLNGWEVRQPWKGGRGWRKRDCPGWTSFQQWESAGIKCENLSVIELSNDYWLSYKPVVIPLSGLCQH